MRVKPAIFLAAALLATPAFARSIGPEVPVAAPVIEPAPFDRSAVAVASNGIDFALVWQDSFGIRAARVTKDGQVRDRPSLLVAPGSRPVIASDGDRYVIAHNCTSSGSAVCVERFDPSSGAIATVATIANATNAAIASNGDGYLLVYQLRRANITAITAVALAPDGSIAGTPFQIVTVAYPAVVASNGTTYFVVWSSYSLLHGVLTSSSEVIGSRQQLSATLPNFGPGPFGWSVASNGSEYLAVWQQNVGVSESRYTTDLRVARISADGVAQPEQVVTDDLEPWMPSVAWTGSRYVLSVTKAERSGAPYIGDDTPSDIWLFGVDPTGHVSGEGAIAAEPDVERASVLATNGANTLVAWEHGPVPGRGEIEATLRSNVLIGDAPRAPITVSYALTWQDSPAAIGNGAQTIVAWDENHGDEQRARVLVARLDANGRPLDGPGLPVAPWSWDQRRPALAGQRIVWIEEDPTLVSESGMVLLQGLDATGAPDGEAIAISRAPRGARVAIAAIDTTYLVVWESWTGIDAVIVEDDFMSELIPISMSEVEESWPDVAADGSRFLVTWNREWDSSICGGLCARHSLHSVAVTRCGSIASAIVDVAPIEAARPRVVWDGAAFTIFWTGYDDATGNFIGARRMSPDGYPLSEARKLAIGTTLHAASWNGNEFLLATTSNASLSLVRLDRELGVLDATPLSSRARDDASAAIAGATVVYLDRGSERASSRAVSRRVGDDVGVPRRRSIR